MKGSDRVRPRQGSDQAGRYVTRVLTDAREVPRDSVLRADICVIGGGAAGITIAWSLANTSRSVIVLESGGAEGDDRTQALAAGDDVGEPYSAPLDAARLRMVGGTTNHWAGYCRPLDPVDFDARPGRPDAAWPLTRAELDPWYAQAHEVIQIGPYEYDWRWWRARLGLSDAIIDTDTVGTEVVQIAQDQLGIRNFRDMYFEELAQARNIQFCVWANVVELDTNRDATRVSGARVVTLDGNAWRAEAQVYVVAVGGLETPRLLLASRSARREGLGNEHDLVGRYFMEHLQVSTGPLVLARPLADLSLYTLVQVPAEEGRREQRLLGELRPTASAVDRHELLASDVVLLPRELDEQPASEEVNAVTASDVSRLLEQVEGSSNASADVVVGAEQRPDPESRVRLSDEEDELGMPRLELDWRIGRDDRESVVRSLMLVAMELTRLGAGRLHLLPVGETPLPILPAASAWDSVPDQLLDFPVGGGFHHMGTTRMHDDPSRGVVDRACKVHGVENLYIASCAVFPTGGSAPPTSTVVALALRLADHLARAVLT